MTDDEYHSDPTPSPSLSSSLAKILLSQSPAHARLAHPRLNHAHEPVESSRFDIGTASHALVLEGADRCAILDFDDWRSKTAREARDEARATGLLPLLRKNYGQIVAMADEAHRAFAACPDFGGIAIPDGQVEQSLFWQESNVWCRSRLDWISPDRKLVLDYKTTENANPDAIIPQIIRMSYDLQAGFYLRALREFTGQDAQFVFMFQEISPPYAVTFIGLPPAWIAMGSEKAEEAIAIWQRCMKTGRWPGYPHQIMWAEEPAWGRAAWEEKMLHIREEPDLNCLDA